MGLHAGGSIKRKFLSDHRTQDYIDAVKATKAAGETKGEYEAIDVKVVWTRMRTHGREGGGAKPAKRSASAPRQTRPESKSSGGGGKPPVKPPSRGQTVQGGEEPRRGSVDRSRVPTGVKQHELDTAQRLADRGDDVVFTPASGVGKSADVMIDGQVWELKSVTGASPDAVARNIRRASDQAPRTILDLTDSPISDDVAKLLTEHYAKRYNMESVRLIRGFDGLDWTYNRAEH